MATNKYITLANSTGALKKRFKAVEVSFPRLNTDTIDLTLGGKTDKQAGPRINQFRYNLRVPIDTPESADYGVYGDLATLYDLSNANATPNDIITLTDHYGASHYVYFNGDMMPQPLTTMLEGVNAWHMVTTVFQEIT